MGTPNSEQTGIFVELIKRFRQGDRVAAGRLVETLYPELRKLAAQKMAHKSGDTSWQPTLLVHELFLHLNQIKGTPFEREEPDVDAAQEKAWFMGLAGQIMRRKLIDHARLLRMKARKLDPDIAFAEIPAAGNGQEALQYVEGLLATLGSVDPRLRTVVEGRVFLGLTLSEIGQRLDTSERTAATYWSFARSWLADQMESEPEAA